MRRLLVTAMIGTAAFGCAHTEPVHHATPAAPSVPIQLDELDAVVDPPSGWTLQRADDTARYIQRVWVSPTGYTSYGVVRFTLPLPVGEDIALAGFLSQMRQDEGEARLLSKGRDSTAQDRLRFVAEGGRYHVDGTILTRGFHGWVIYSGRLRNG